MKRSGDVAENPRTSERITGAHEIVEPIILAPGEGKVHRGLETHVLKAGGEATSGAYSLYEETFPPGHPGPAIHIHHDQEEAFFVIEGGLTFLLGERLITATKGTFVLIPAGWRHGFANRSGEVAKAINMHSPRGFEGAFEQLGSFAVRPPEAASIQEYVHAHNVEFDGPPLGSAPPE